MLLLMKRPDFFMQHCVSSRLLSGFKYYVNRFNSIGRQYFKTSELCCYVLVSRWFDTATDNSCLLGQKRIWFFFSRKPHTNNKQIPKEIKDKHYCFEDHYTKTRINYCVIQWHDTSVFYLYRNISFVTMFTVPEVVYSCYLMIRQMISAYDEKCLDEWKDLR